jgi:hypothetical protein
MEVVGSEDVNWTVPIQVRVQWKAFVIKTMKVWVQ